MNNLKKATEQLLEELENYFNAYPHMQKGYVIDAIANVRQALAEPEQEPVGRRLYKDGELYAIKYEKEDRGSHYTWEPLYTASINPQEKPNE